MPVNELQASNMIQISNVLTKIVRVIRFAAVAHLTVGKFLRDAGNSVKVLMIIIIIIIKRKHAH